MKLAAPAIERECGEGGERRGGHCVCHGAIGAGVMNVAAHVIESKACAHVY